MDKGKPSTLPLSGNVVGQRSWLHRLYGYHCHF